MPGYPLVLHGASSVPQEFVEMCNTYGGKVAGAAGVPEELLRKAAGMAICKINIDTDIRLAMTASIRKQLAEHPEEFDPRGYLKPARQAVKEIAVWFGSRLSLSLVLETPERIVISKARVPEFKAWLTSVQPAE